MRLGLDVEFLAQLVADARQVPAALVQPAPQFGFRGGGHVNLFSSGLGLLLRLFLSRLRFLGGLGGLRLLGGGIQDSRVEFRAFLHDAEIVLESADRVLGHKRHGFLEFAHADKRADEGDDEEDGAYEQGSQPGGHDGGKPHDGRNDESGDEEGDKHQCDGQERCSHPDLDALALQLDLREGDFVVELPWREFGNQP
ncbi:hypothetical protein D9M72_487930 [compost metagenome]